MYSDWKKHPLSYFLSKCQPDDAIFIENVDYEIDIVREADGTVRGYVMFYDGDAATRSSFDIPACATDEEFLAQCRHGDKDLSKLDWESVKSHRQLKARIAELERSAQHD